MPATNERQTHGVDHSFWASLKRSDNLAIVVIAALEGAIILVRIRRDLTPFDALIRELGPVLDGVAWTGAPGRSI